MSESESGSASLESLTNCGSCFFELPIGVAPLPEDKPASLGVEVFYVHPSLRISSVKDGVDLMRRSAERGCSACVTMHKYLLSHISTQDSINWSGMFDTGIRVFSGNVNPSPTLDTVEVGSRGKIDRPPSPPTMAFDLFCPPEEWVDAIPQFNNQSVRLMHPFLNVADHPSGNTKSELAMDRLNHWLTTCLSCHSACGKLKDPFTSLPERILWLEDENRLKVIENNASTEPYACLSHRWGKSTANVSLLTTNLSRCKAGLLVSSLPQLFRDVIYLCRQLGLRYLWIDSLCIVQDDLNDWETVAATMGSIYENAFITISADWDSNSDQSLFNKLPSSHLAFEIPTVHGSQIFIRKQFSHPWKSTTNDPGKETCGDLPLLKRGWVFQERALSKRIIHFTPYELCWECVERTCCECRLNEGQWDALRSQVPRTVANESWDSIVQEYSMLDLSFDKDKLQALAGVSRRYALQHGLHFAAGLWRERLDRDFVWRRLQFSPSRPRPDPVIAPTWSWASTSGSIWMSHSDRCDNIKFLDFNFEPLGIDPYGSAKFARLHISGFMIRGTIHYGEEWQNILRERSKFTANPDPLMQDLAKTNLMQERYKGIVIQDEVYRWLPDYSVDVPGSYEILSGSEVSCLLCCEGIIAGVILKVREKLTGCYERLGVLDNDPFVRVPVKALMDKATERELFLM